MIELTNEPIDMQRGPAEVGSRRAGAIVVFWGTTREFTEERQTVELTYEAYTEMAQTQLEQLELEARQRWPLEGCLIVHRLGRVEIAEPSVLIAVSSPHRREAFAAAQWLMDRIKEDVPIWKQEHWADGTTDWIHPEKPGN